ncbi:iron(III) transport system ATP-binding protein [Nonomuraea thailandensis]|uniref:ABC-type quaternary amine transporter n=1 Tax=Nonomuraea thailandensis TaxID=1188745 RepID=A0A9X2GJQ7_9ACTN|nr:ABC transporter ATP-binding protein [Nonomuraea thailandensis]MCP2355818.1 iron(III) transport system ATP-binding protein [Nonomuraea thailandensis]
MPEVKVTHLSKQFGDNAVLRDISFTIADGEFFTLLGPSGCGKSTTLACIAGLERPTRGSIAVGSSTFVDTGTFVPPEGRNLGMVFQSYALWPHMTVARNLAMPLKIRKVDRREQDRLIADALDKVGLAGLSDRFPHQLSGGQQQRVALARALVYSPSVLLLDEPLSNLDAKLRDQARAWLKRLQTELGITTVYVTHDQEEALALSDRIAVMSRGDMVQIGTPQDIYERPATAEVAAFVGRCNFLTGATTGPREVRLDCTGQTITVPDTAPGGPVTVAIRPERLEILPPGRAAPAGANVLTAEVLTSSYVGSRHEYDLRLGDHVIQAETSRPGLTGEVVLAVEPAACLLYPATGALPEDAAALVTTAQ